MGDEGGGWNFKRELGKVIERSFSFDSLFELESR